MMKILKNKWFITIIAIIIVIVAVSIFRANSKTLKFTVAELSNIKEQVSVTGKVLPLQKSDLSFGKSGNISNIWFKVGDTIKPGDVIASLNDSDDRSSYMAYQASYLNTAKGLTSQELRYEKDRLETSKLNYENALRAALVSARDGFTKAQSSFLNGIDQFFINPQSVNPTINIRTQSSIESANINNLKLLSNEAISSMRLDLERYNSTSSALELVTRAHKNIDKVKEFMDLITSIVNNISPGNSGQDQTTIDGYASILNSALSNFNQAYNTISTAEANLKSSKGALDEALSTYNVKLSGASKESLMEAKARADQANAILEKNKIISPIAGILTKAEPNIGEYVNAGQVVFSVMSNEIFKIEANVPETDISKLSLENKASVTLDAYGEETPFEATVINIDPAETIIEGVPTYKVTLIFDKADPRIRSGMTANIKISTRSKDSVLAIPVSAISGTDGNKTVKKLSDSGKSFDIVTVSTGLKGSNGLVEILSGLNVGDKVVSE
jgi:RND family efflux transporter MFP subunit